MATPAFRKMFASAITMRQPRKSAEHIGSAERFRNSRHQRSNACANDPREVSRTDADRIGELTRTDRKAVSRRDWFGVSGWLRVIARERLPGLKNLFLLVVPLLVGLGFSFVTWVRMGQQPAHDQHAAPSITATTR